MIFLLLTLASKLKNAIDYEKEKTYNANYVVIYFLRLTYPLLTKNLSL